MKPPEDPLLLNHEVDGIRELDNKLPRWWVWLFYLTILFAVLYFPYYHLFGAAAKSSATEYQIEAARGDKLKQAALDQFEAVLVTLQPSKDEGVLARGHATFLNLCAPCHRPDAGGLVGPNLTDDYWIHGSNFVDNVKTILNGVPEKGMITWKGLLKPDEIKAVASYIYTLRGTKPPNPKPPENQVPADTGPSVYE